MHLIMVMNNVESSACARGQHGNSPRRACAHRCDRDQDQGRRACEIPDGRALASCARGIAGTDVQIAGWRLGRRSAQALYYESFGIPGT